ncbi:hypothetical protein [Actinomycetospora soli]|uniref:hypothetical protein n=1 Tax=Actinomycetospora soli TaxID=2893887 RepID=UPI001E4C4EE8|nr:hypothetical protein [Actinomycetospora soli]MCD2186771.1 hypothetical protein [Actinomycetospora soli]
MSPKTPAARRVALGGLAALAALAATPGLATAAELPTLPTTLPTDGVTEGAGLGPDPLTAVVGGGLSSIPGSDSATTPDDPTPVPVGAQYGAKPETVLLGVPLNGLLNSVQRSTAIIPGSGPGDYA